MGIMKKMFENEYDKYIKRKHFQEWISRLGVDIQSPQGYAFQYPEGVSMLKKLWNKYRGNPENTIKLIKLSAHIINGNAQPVQIKYIRKNGIISEYTIRIIDLDKKKVQAIDTKTNDLKEFILERITEVSEENEKTEK